MTREQIKDILRQAGRADALRLRDAAAGLSGTEIIAREQAAPAFDPGKDYSTWPVGAPVQDDGQVWTLIQPHNAAEYLGRPATLRALWGLCHTTDPRKAKPWVDPVGTSGLYLKDECYLSGDGTVYRCLVEQTNFDATAVPDYWEAANGR